MLWLTCGRSLDCSGQSFCRTQTKLTNSWRNMYVRLTDLICYSVLRSVGDACLSRTVIIALDSSGGATFCLSVYHC